MQLKVTPNPDHAESADPEATWLLFLAEIAAEIGPSDLCAGLSFIDDATIRGLNREYRGKDAATDVLSFSYGAAAAGHADPEEDIEGEILISLDTARRQAEAADHDLRQEVSVLVIHGLYHILGMDHEDDAEAEAMETAEAPYRQRIARYFRDHSERS